MDNRCYTLITGASEGFGKALAFECASRNMNLVLVALPGNDLDSLGAFLERNFGVDTITIATDLSKEENCISLYEQVCRLGLKLNMLINNAGIGSTLLFEEGSAALYQQQIKLNVLATTLLTRLFVDMLRQNGPAYILNVGSLSAFFFTPKKQVYGATKSFIYFFSKCLRRELKHSGVNVTVICPGGMNTNPAQFLQQKNVGCMGRLSVMDPGTVATAAINGLLKQKGVIIPGKVNRLFLLADKILPSLLKNQLLKRQMDKMRPARSAAPAMVIQVPASLYR